MIFIDLLLFIKLFKIVNKFSKLVLVNRTFFGIGILYSHTVQYGGHLLNMTIEPLLHRDCELGIAFLIVFHFNLFKFKVK